MTTLWWRRRVAQRRLFPGDSHKQMSDKRIIVAIDGPGASGKSTVALRVAAKLGYLYINTGAMYRAMALWALRLNVAPSDMHRMEQLANQAQITLDAQDGHITLNGEDVTEAIRDERVSVAASKVSAIPAVRRALVRIQRGMAEENSVVMEGRDIGSVVFPDAQVKIFLDALPEERARRRARELEQKGLHPDLSVVAAELQKRDDRDRHRSQSPLTQAPDATLVDTTGLSIEEVEEVILRLVRARVSNGKEAAR
ncbi:MAG: (d)CMP kinase [Acidobacteriaceae bacterium]|nr:(d)CMP kinase [Acidobacteriaceae bacterium]